MDNEVAFSSEWDIDQVLEDFPIIVSIPAGADTLLYTFSNAAKPPLFEVQFQPAGSTFWYQDGSNSTDNAVTGMFTTKSWIDGLGINMNSDIAGRARLYVWVDSFNE